MLQQTAFLQEILDSDSKKWFSFVIFVGFTLLDGLPKSAKISFGKWVFVFLVLKALNSLHTLSLACLCEESERERERVFSSGIVERTRDMQREKRLEREA